MSSDYTSEELASLSKSLRTPECDRRCEFRIWISDTWYKFAPCWLDSVRRSLRQFYLDQISTRIWPRQRWLTKQIPRRWCDKVSLLPDVLYAMAVHFVDENGEDAFRVTDFAASGLAEHEAKLREIYTWAKTGRAEFLKRIDMAHPKRELPVDEKGKFDFVAWVAQIHEETTPYDQLYGEVNRLEAELAARDTEYLTWLVANRAILWC